MRKTVCDFCEAEAQGARPKGWGTVWVFFSETETVKQTDFMLDVCSKECLVKRCPQVKKPLERHTVEKDTG